MTLAEFRELVCRELGEHLERATPASVRDFLDRFHEGVYRQAHPPGEPLEIDEHATSFEQVFAEFFRTALTMPAEQAVIQLWLFGLEQHFAQLGQLYREEYAHLLDTDEPQGAPPLA